METKLQREREKLVNILQKISFQKLENKFIIFEVETYDPNSEIAEKWYPIYQMKNQQLEFLFSPADQNQYGDLDSCSSIGLTDSIEFLKKIKAKQVFSLAGIPYFDNLFGVDMTRTYEDEELGIMDYQKNCLFNNSSWEKEMLKNEKIELKIPFLTEKSLKYYI